MPDDKITPAPFGVLASAEVDTVEILSEVTIAGDLLDINGLPLKAYRKEKVNEKALAAQRGQVEKLLAEIIKKQAALQATKSP